MKDEIPQLSKQITHIFARQSSITCIFYSRYSSTDLIGSIAVSYCYDIDASSGLVSHSHTEYHFTSLFTLYMRQLLVHSQSFKYCL